MKTRQLAICLSMALFTWPVAVSHAQKPGMSNRPMTPHEAYEEIMRDYPVSKKQKKAEEEARQNVLRRFGTEQRRRIYAELTRAEARATHNAAQTYEPPFRNPAEMNAFMALEDRLSDRYRREIEKKHRLTPVQRKAIEREGNQKDWPAPGIMKERR